MTALPPDDLDMAEMDAKTMLIELRGKLDRAKAVYDMASARNVANLDAAARVDSDIAYQAAWLNFSRVEGKYRAAIEKAIARSAAKLILERDQEVKL